jgi:hypothetical protein
MEPVEVDVVGLQATKRLLALRKDRLTASATAVRITGVKVIEKLRGQHHSLAASAVLGDKVADDLLRMALGIEISGIDEVAAAFQEGTKKDGYAPTRPNQEESIFQRLTARLGLTYSRSRRWRKRQVCEVFLCATLSYSRVTVRSNVFSKKVKKPFYFWRESRRTREKRTQSDRFRLPQRKNRNKPSTVVRVFCHPQRKDGNAKPVESKR